MSYYKQLLDLTDRIYKVAKKIETHQRSADKYANPSGEVIWFGDSQCSTFREDGTPNPIVNDIRLAYVAAHQRQVFALKSELEGLRWKMAQLMKEAA